ncbi:sensor histidine kinase [Actinomadura yumaensis]|nr:sensor histidine kinase [Actinomadura sp. J1-007]MWK36613.1 sensor histidine kinase [Actinomadura sp. J1-007]
MHDTRLGLGPGRLLLTIALTVLVLNLVRRRPLPAFALLTLAWVGAAMELRGSGTWIVQTALMDVAVGYVAAARSRRFSVSLAGAALLAQVLTAAAFPDQPDELVSRSSYMIMAMVVVWLVGNSVRVRRAHAEELTAQATARAVADERLRIARELHDMVAHSVGIIAIQAGAGGRVIDTQPGEARNALGAIEATSRETLSGLRRMLGMLRRAEPEGAPLDPAPGLDDLDRLVAATLGAGVRVDLRVRGERRPLPAEIDLSAFRIVQEALTNVVRHAGTDGCRVTIGFGDDELRVEVVDDGRGPAPGSAGYGLVGMRERVGLLKGRLDAGPGPHGGFRVEARLPVPAVAR